MRRQICGSREGLALVPCRMLRLHVRGELLERSLAAWTHAAGNAVLDAGNRAFVGIATPLGVPKLGTRLVVV